VLPTSVFAAPVWTDGLEADGDAGPAVVLVAGLDGLMTDCVMVAPPVLVLVTLPYAGGMPPPDGRTTGGAGGAGDAGNAGGAGGAGGRDGAADETAAEDEMTGGGG